MKISQPALDTLRKDPVLSPILERPYNRPAFASRGLFGDLVSAIISQQVSTAAARTIHGRLRQRFDDDHISMHGLRDMTAEELRACGISRQKSGYLRNIAEHFIEGDRTESDYVKLSDEAIIKDLTEIKGVGVWTVQMILMTTFNRPDVFPTGDLGIQNVMIDLYDLKHSGKELHRRMEEIAVPWRPYRSYACLYMWNTLH